jgi:hypothetical protein
MGLLEVSGLADGTLGMSTLHFVKFVAGLRVSWSNGKIFMGKWRMRVVIFADSYTDCGFAFLVLVLAHFLC